MRMKGVIDMKTKCERCDKELRPEDLFCPKCGTKGDKKGCSGDEAGVSRACKNCYKTLRGNEECDCNKVEMSDEIRGYIDTLKNRVNIKGLNAFDRMGQGIAKIRDWEYFPSSLPGRGGAITLTEWKANWSVKWYSNEGNAQIQLADPVSEYDARRIFAELRKWL